MRILKFGGSSLADPGRIRQVTEIIKRYLAEGREISIVVSAMGGVTDKLAEICRMIPDDHPGAIKHITEIESRHLDAAGELIPVKMQPAAKAEIINLCNNLGEIVRGVTLVGEVTSRSRDMILGFGELLSAWLVSRVLVNDYPDILFTDARKYVKTGLVYDSAKVLYDRSFNLIRNYYATEKGTRVITGFIASTEDGRPTTLGRNGSDYTASIFGAALNADTIEIWGDTDGVLTADPALVDEARNIGQLSYNEAMELSHFGAKVIFPASLLPAMEKSIPIIVRNTFNPAHKGTLICTEPSSDNGFIKGITSLPDISIINVEGSGMVGVAGVAARMFTSLSGEKISVILISQASSEHSICIAVLTSDAPKATTVLRDTFSRELETGIVSSINYESGLAIIAVVGENMRYTPGVASRVFNPLGRNGINIKAISQGSSELNISFVITSKDLKKALRVLHQSLFRDELRQLNLFIAGTGLVGGRLLDMIGRHNLYLNSKKIELKVCGIINSRMMTVSELSDSENWRMVLENGSGKADLDMFIDKMVSRNLENSVLVDATASAEPVKHYTKLLASSISIVTANKVANTGDYSQYSRIREAAGKRGVSFHYETNVGAGLPVINVIRNLISGGDKVRKIEGILSGTLNWLLSEYAGNVPFSDLVKKARSLGYTEPDPRDDLSGTDVARKCLILARECGLVLEMNDIEAVSLIAPGIKAGVNLDGFYEELARAEPYYNERFRKAAEKNMKLRYMATIENGTAATGLNEVDESHPFYGLRGTENCIILTTDYYLKYPMVIKGPGAGAEVTAAGLLADIVRIAEQVRV